MLSTTYLSANYTIKGASILFCFFLFTVPVNASIKKMLMSPNENKIQFAYFEQLNFSNHKLIFSNHPSIQKFKAQYTSPEGLEYLSKVMQRSLLYRDFILDLLDTYQIPKELLFLPVIESGYSEYAVSKSGATGIWQFMENSISGYDISISEWLDERRDPWKTSLAAVKKLAYNYSVLGDWALALAAYNAGLNAIKRSISSAGRADFWYLSAHGYLKTETAQYVPKFLAITEILIQSQEFNIEWGNPKSVIQTETVSVHKAIDLHLLEKELSLSDGALSILNPALKYSITPPDQTYELRVPSEYASQVLNLLEKGTVLISYYMYEIKSGDTLYALSKHYGVSVQAIIQANNGINPNILKIGQKLIIPALKEVGMYMGNREKIGIFTSRYTVKQGDTLWSIALAHNTTVENLAEQNKLSVSSILKIGAVLLVP